MQVFLSGNCLNTTSYDGVQGWREMASLRAMGSGIGTGWGGNIRTLTGTTRGDENGRGRGKGGRRSGRSGWGRRGRLGSQGRRALAARDDRRCEEECDLRTSWFLLIGALGLDGLLPNYQLLKFLLVVLSELAHDCFNACRQLSFAHARFGYQMGH